MRKEKEILRIVVWCRALLPLGLFLTLFLFSSCIKEEEYDDNPRGNFEALWNIMDQHYCFSRKRISTGMPSTPNTLRK